MTKEDLEEMCKFTPKNSEEAMFIKAITEFLDSNVIIPKGKNPHPYADVLHAWAEGTIVQHRIRGEIKWTTQATFDYDFEYQIKPSDPIYEWQWLYKHNSTSETYIATQFFMTDEEAVDDLNNEFHFMKIEETERERA